MGLIEEIIGRFFCRGAAYLNLSFQRTQKAAPLNSNVRLINKEE